MKRLWKFLKKLVTPDAELWRMVEEDAKYIGELQSQNEALNWAFTHQYVSTQETVKTGTLNLAVMVTAMGGETDISMDLVDQILNFPGEVKVDIRRDDESRRLFLKVIMEEAKIESA